MGRRNEPRLLEPTTGSRPAWLRRLWSDPESRRFLVMLSLTGSYCLTEMVTGVYLDSLALQSDAMHMLSDALALIVGLAATIVGRRQTGAATARVDAVGGPREMVVVEEADARPDAEDVPLLHARKRQVGADERVEAEGEQHAEPPRRREGGDRAHRNLRGDTERCERRRERRRPDVAREVAVERADEARDETRPRRVDRHRDGHWVCGEAREEV